MRFPLRTSGLLGAAAVAGAIVYWRAIDRQRSRELTDEVDAGITDGRTVAGALLKGADDNSQRFDDR